MTGNPGTPCDEHRAIFVAAAGPMAAHTRTTRRGLRTRHIQIRRVTSTRRGCFPGSSPANIAATAGSSAFFTSLASLPGRAGWPPGASSSATRHPRSSPTRSASRRAQRCAMRSSAGPTGPPTPLEDVLTPRTTRRPRRHRDGVSPSALERACHIRRARSAGRSWSTPGRAERVVVSRWRAGWRFPGTAGAVVAGPAWSGSAAGPVRPGWAVPGWWWSDCSVATGRCVPEWVAGVGLGAGGRSRCAPCRVRSSAGAGWHEHGCARWRS